MNPNAHPFELCAHPAHAAPAGVRVWAAAQWATQTTTAEPVLHLHYAVQAPAHTLLWPPAATPSAVDGLWQSTCLEVFVAAADAPHPGAYHEFNFSPSGQWALYHFTAPRQRAPHSSGPNPTDPIDGPALNFVPAITSAIAHGDTPALQRWTLHTTVPPHALPDSGSSGTWRLGLNAVLQTTDGRLSYWALHHPLPARPDFHHPDGRVFSLSLPHRP